ncbi:MAG: glycosyltransferase family 4 protein [Patescibacteria group bacterium]
MKILWFTWKDKSHPQAGGAETVNEELAKRLAADGHEVIFLVGGFTDGKEEETRDGFKIIRLGNRWTVYWQAYRYYKKNLRGWADLVIDEVNTIPFFCKFYVRERNILFVHQLCRVIWFYQIWFPLSLVGYLLEPLYLWLLRDREVITISKSTKKDLMRFGFRDDNINIISEGIEIEPVQDLDSIKKYEAPTILSLGSIRAMKRTDHIIQAFEMAKKKLPDLRLIVAGEAEGLYGRKVLRLIKVSAYRGSIEYLGRVDVAKKLELLQRSHILCATSVKEGWGLVVTEAASQGTPAIVYDVDGLRDVVRSGNTGVVCKKNNIINFTNSILEILEKKIEYQKLRRLAWDLSKGINFSKSYQKFLNLVTGENK